MSTLLQLWREVCGRSPALVNQEGKHLIVSESDCALLGSEIERAAPAPAAQSAGQEAVAWRYRESKTEKWGFTRHHPRNFVRMPKFVEPLYVAPVNASVPVGETALRSRWNRIANSEDMFEQFVAEVRALIAAPVNSGTHALWDVYAFGKWQMRVSAPAAWDAYTVYLDMVKNRWSKNIELRGVSSGNYGAPVDGGELEAARTEAYRKGVADGRREAEQRLRAADAQQVGGEPLAQFESFCRANLDMAHLKILKIDGLFQFCEAWRAALSSPAKVGKDAELMCKRLRNMELMTCGEAADLIERLAALTSPAKDAQQKPMTDRQIIELCTSVGVEWEGPDMCDFMGDFGRVNMAEMRAIIAAAKEQK